MQGLTGSYLAGTTSGGREREPIAKDRPPGQNTGWCNKADRFLTSRFAAEQNVRYRSPRGDTARAQEDVSYKHYLTVKHNPPSYR